MYHMGGKVTMEKIEAKLREADIDPKTVKAIWPPYGTKHFYFNRISLELIVFHHEKIKDTHKLECQAHLYNPHTTFCMVKRATNHEDFESCPTCLFPKRNRLRTVHNPKTHNCEKHRNFKPPKPKHGKVLFRLLYG